MSSFFIKHPTIAIVISIVMILLGGLSLMGLPIEQYPNIVPPTIKMQATYPGANAETVANSVASPIEQSISGVVGMDYMTSTNANNGICSLSIVFEVGTDPNMDQTLAYMRYGQATAQIPAEVSQMGITITQSTGSPLAVINLYSPDDSLNAIFLSNYAYVSLVDPVKRVPGVGDVQVFGAGRYAMRIWLDTTKMAAQNISVGEVQSAIQAQNTVIPGGQIGAEPAPPGTEFTYSIQTKGRLQTAEEFGNIIIRADGNKLLYLKDIAKVELGSQTYNVSSKYNGRDSGAIAVYAAPGSNAINTVDALVKLFEDRSRSFPAGMEYNLTLDTTLAVRASIEEIEHTLLEALLLVVLVVFVFLQGWRATLIPAIAVPVSIIATFALFPLLGFTLNTICLMGMVLAIGLVVDDAIVVVENVERIMHEEKLSPYDATKKAMEGLTGAIVATSLVLAAVFVPVSFLGGITGQLYRQFTVTIVVSVLLSTVVALTLSPVMCSLILKPETRKRKNKVFRYINYALNTGNRKYVRQISRVIGNPRRVMGAFGVVLVGIFLLNRLIPTSFLPVEDQGYFKVELELPEGATLERTRAVTERAVEYLMQNPTVEYVQSVVGSSPRVGSSQARSELTVIMKPWEARDGQTVDKVMAQVKKDLQEYPECKVYLSTPPVIPGLGSSGGFEMQLEARGDATFDNLVQATDTLMYYASQCKELSGLSSSLQADIPQLYFDVDRDKVKLAGVPLADVFSTMKAYTGSVYVNDFNMFNRIYRVYIQAEAPYREHKENINLFFVRGTGNVMIPLTSLGTTSYTTGPGSIKRFNMFNSAVIRGGAADGYSSGQAMEVIEKVAREHLPDNIGVEWSGLSYQEKQAGGKTAWILALVFLFVFLFLAALYESWSIPVAVLLSLPVAALGAYLGVWLGGLENDVYFQIGLVMLVGLAAKNAILIVEFAKEQVDGGANVVKAALHASQLRFRPILMTSLAFILGMLPMVIASGPGAASRQAIGTGVFFGMILAVTAGILLVPFFFVLIYKAKAKAKSASIKQVTKRLKR